MTTRTSLLALAFALLTVALAAPAAAQGPAPRVFIVGDSHVQMIGPLLSRQLREDGFEVAGYEARPGWSSLRYQRAGDLQQVLEDAGRPEVVVVSLGGNDIPAGPESYAAQLEWVVSQARAAGAQRIVWLGPATSDSEVSRRAEVVGARHQANAQLQSEILPALGVTWVDSRPCTCDHHGHDGIHFTRAGYHHWVHHVLTPVERVASAPTHAAPAA